MGDQAVRKTTDARRREFRAILEWAARLPRPRLDYSQIPDQAFLRVQFYYRLLTHQSAYMLLLRSFAAMYGEGLVPEPLLRPGGLSGADIVAWSSGLTVRRLFESFCACQDRHLVAFIADLRMEGTFLDREWADRLKDKPVTQEFIRMDWGGEDDRTKQIEQLLRVDKIRGKSPNPAEDGEDIQLTAWEKAFSVWRTPASAASTPPQPLPGFPFRPDAILPDEKAFWDGPMTRAWELGQAEVLRDAVPLLAGEREVIPEKVRAHLRNEWATRDRRATLQEGTEDFPETGPELGRAIFDWSPPARVSRSAEIAGELHPRRPSPADALRKHDHEVFRSEQAYAVAQKRWGERGRKFLDALKEQEEENITEASTAAGVSRQIGHKYVRELRKALSRKKNLT